MMVVTDTNNSQETLNKQVPNGQFNLTKTATPTVDQKRQDGNQVPSRQGCTTSLAMTSWRNEGFFRKTLDHNTDKRG